MSRRQKLFERIETNPTNISYSQLRTLIESFGYELRSGGKGSHRWFTKTGCPPIHFPQKNPLGEVYVKKVLKILRDLAEADDSE